MYLANAVLATGACLLQFCATSQAIAFGKWPHELTPGKPATVKWTENTDSPVKITLCKGKATDLKQVKTLTEDADGDSEQFTWYPDESLEDGDDYALAIEQDGSKNYSGHITVSHELSQIPPNKGPNPLGSSTAFGTAPRKTDTGVAKGNSAEDHDSSESPVVSGKNVVHQEQQTAGASVYGVPLRLALGTVAVLFCFTT